MVCWSHHGRLFNDLERSLQHIVNHKRKVSKKSIHYDHIFIENSYVHIYNSKRTQINRFCVNSCISGWWDYSVLYSCLAYFILFFFSFWFRGGQGATFFDPSESGFVWHQPPPPCWRSLAPMRSKSYFWDAPWGSWWHVCRGPKISPLCVSKRGWWWQKKVGEWNGLRVTGKLIIRKRQAQGKAIGPFCLCPDHQSH